ncbi:hypothetical protein HRW23_36720, partial [Streptomyces lunaelactis]|uniref:hypothetical protein n=1 Tax=Streptomyces lunaelactis TaxID=1535768 RepID=UPI0015851721|nr:hypothetical protein [Streptomyces lunaelactis]
MHLRLRLRIAGIGAGRRALVLTNTPRPTCTTCHGDGGWSEDYGHPETGEYEGTHDVLCDCWTDRRWVLLPLPRRPRVLRRRH